MPFKCIKCNTVVQTLDDAECDCTNPKFVKAEMIHYLREDGPGRPYTKTRKDVGVPTEEAVLRQNVLRLCCDTKDRTHLIQASFMSSLVTCPKCLQFLSEVRDNHPPGGNRPQPPEDNPVDTPEEDNPEEDPQVDTQPVTT